MSTDGTDLFRPALACDTLPEPDEAPGWARAQNRHVADGLCQDRDQHVAEVYLPSAAPVPRGPSVLLLGSAAGLLDRPGCPVCRYVAEASDAYLAWFALDGHYDGAVLSRICASRGMCPPHTRRLLSQPGAETRLTAVYRYVIEAAMRDLYGRPAALCPACEHDTAAADRVLGILLEDVMSTDRFTYKRHGGLCLPHLRRAAGLGKRVDLRWAFRFMMKQLTEQPPSLELLAGWPDPDADARVALRAALPLRRPCAGDSACLPCWAAASAEREQLAGARSAARWAPASLPDDCLCEPHLRDLVLGSDNGASGVLSWQAACEAVRLATVLDARPRRLGISTALLSVRSRRALADQSCRVCRSSDLAGSQEIARLQAMLWAEEPKLLGGSGMCLRHAVALHAMDALAGRLAAGLLSDRCSQLADELATAFTMQTWAHRDDPRGAEMTAWRRVAAFLDGAVLGGCPA
jgi:hypothetical protein